MWNIGLAYCIRVTGKHSIAQCQMTGKMNEWTGEIRSRLTRQVLVIAVSYDIRTCKRWRHELLITWIMTSEIWKMARMTASTLPEMTTSRSVELTRTSAAICIDAPAACTTTSPSTLHTLRTIFFINNIQSLLFTILSPSSYFSRSSLLLLLVQLLYFC